MHQKAWELQERTARFAAAVAALCERVPADPGAQRIARKLLASARTMETAYKDVCASRTPDEFIHGITIVARHARQAKRNLQLLLQLNHLPIASARDPLFEARGLENIFVASRKTAKNRQRAGTARASR